MARPGGHVVIDSRNWEKLHAERRIVQVADRVITRGGRRCFVFYAWEVPDRVEDEHIAHLVFVFEDDGQIEPHEHEITFCPFTASELRERLELAGSRDVDTDFGDSQDATPWSQPRHELRGQGGRLSGLRSVASMGTRPVLSSPSPHGDHPSPRPPHLAK